MRFGIAGVGRMGSAHAEALARHDEVTELVITDADPSRAAEVAAKVGGINVQTIEELLAREVEGVVIATASSTHGELVEAVSSAGIPVFCEKPLALDVAGTLHVRDHVATTGVPVHVGFHRRFDPGYDACRKALDAGAIGELRRVHLLSADPSPPDATFIRASGGIYRDLHIHDFDILRWVTGREVAQVYAQGSNRGDRLFGELGDPDESALLLLLNDGTLATMQGSRYNGAGYDIRMEVAGTRATHVVGLSQRTPVKSAEPGESFPTGEPWVWFWNRFEAAYVAELAAFVDVAAGRRESPCTVDDALEALYIAEAAELSRAQHRPVPIQEIANPAAATR